MNLLHLRFAHPDERLALEELQRRASLVCEEYRVPLLANPDAIYLPQSQLDAQQVRVAERGGEVSGFAVILPRDEEICDLDGLFVEPDRWKAGIGRGLMQDAFLEGAARGMRVMTVTASPQAEGFYAKLGFVRTGTAQTQFGTALKMRRKL